MCEAMLCKVGLKNGLWVSLLDIYKEGGSNKSLQKLVEAAKDSVATQNSSK